MTFAIPLHAAAAADAARVGQKAAALHRLLRAGFPVPAGVCVPTAVFTAAVAPHAPAIAAALAAVDAAAPHTAVSAAANLAAQLHALALPDGLLPALRAALADLPAAPAGWAVRSSAAAEDLPSASFAGQYATHLGVPADGLAAAILACWRSFYAAGALAERARHGLLTADGGMAVLVQPLLPADCAGVCFGVDPLRLDRDLLLVNAAWGLGPGVADGRFPTDAYRVRRADFGIAERQTPAKPRQLAPGAAGGVVETAVPPARQTQPCLPDAWLRRVAQLAVAAENELGAPQDVEWAIAGTRLWLLQSRPQTGLPPALRRPRPFPVRWAAAAERRRLWTLTDGSRDRVPLPLEHATHQAAESIRQEACRQLGADQNGALRIWHGRAYFARQPMPIGDADLRVRRAAYDDLKARLKQEGRSSWDHFGPEIETAVARLQAFDTAGADDAGGVDAALAAHLADALATFKRHQMLHPMLWFKPDDAFVAAVAALSGTAGSAAEQLAHDLLTGVETPLSRLLDALYALAQLAHDPAVAALLAAPPPDVLHRLGQLPAAEPLLAKLDAILRVHGARTGAGYGSEATICTPTWSEQPRQLLQLAAAYLAADVPPPAEVRRRQQAAREARIAAWAAAADAAIVARFRAELAYARRAFAVLEIHNHYIDQLSLGLLRRAVLAAAARLAADGRLAAADDVFWLDYAEIEAALRGDGPRDLAALIAARRAAHARWSALPPPPILGIPPAELPPRPPAAGEPSAAPAAAADDLRGIGASAGQASGPARVLHDTRQPPAVRPGDILVAANAGPLWTPYFPLLGGLVLEEGSLGQHAAATARELGIPAIIQLPDATRRIPDGARVRIDGAAGTITRL